MHTHQKKFTLIELLVVISIISLLISILLPALGAARASARSIQCASNQRGLGVIISLYAEDNNMYYPTAMLPVNRTWQEFLGVTYMSISSKYPTWQDGKRPLKTFACPDSQQVMSAGNKADYGMNWRICNDTSDSKRVDSFVNPTEIVLTVDSVGRSLVYWGNNPNIMGMEGRHKNGVAKTDERNIVNVLYCDGHVTTTAMKELLYPSASSAFNIRPWQP